MFTTDHKATKKEAVDGSPRPEDRKGAAYTAPSKKTTVQSFSSAKSDGVWILAANAILQHAHGEGLSVDTVDLPTN